MTERCFDCNTPDTCNRAGCIESYNDPQLALSDQCMDCVTPNKCFDEGCFLDTETCRLDEGCNNEGRVEDCSFCQNQDLDGRNEGPTNRHGCSYVDCDCVVPCTSKATTVINITHMNGDINF